MVLHFLKLSLSFPLAKHLEAIDRSNEDHDESPISKTLTFPPLRDSELRLMSPKLLFSVVFVSVLMSCFIILNFSTWLVLESFSVTLSGLSSTSANTSWLMSEFRAVPYVWILQCLRLNPQMQLVSEFFGASVWILRCILCLNSEVLASESSEATCVWILSCGLCPNTQQCSACVWILSRLLMSQFSGLCLNCTVDSNVFPFWGWLYSCSYSRNQLMHTGWADISHFIYGSQQGQAEWTQCKNNVKHVINYRNTWASLINLLLRKTWRLELRQGLVAATDDIVTS